MTDTLTEVSVQPEQGNPRELALMDSLKSGGPSPWINSFNAVTRLYPGKREDEVAREFARVVSPIEVGIENFVNKKVESGHLQGDTDLGMERSYMAQDISRRIASQLGIREQRIGSLREQITKLESKGKHDKVAPLQAQLTSLEDLTFEQVATGAFHNSKEELPEFLCLSRFLHCYEQKFQKPKQNYEFQELLNHRRLFFHSILLSFLFCDYNF